MKKKTEPPGRCFIVANLINKACWQYRWLRRRSCSFSDWIILLIGLWAFDVLPTALQYCWRCTKHGRADTGLGTMQGFNYLGHPRSMARPTRLNYMVIFFNVSCSDCGGAAYISGCRWCYFPASASWTGISMSDLDASACCSFLFVAGGVMVCRVGLSWMICLTFSVRRRN